MKPNTAKVLIRILGTVAGLLGVGLLCFAPFVFYRSITEQNPVMIAFAVLPLALAAYFLYVAYLVWFRFSPLAVRHVCGALGFYALTLLTKLFDPMRDSGVPWRSCAFLGCLVAVFLAYRFASGRLSRWLFPESPSGVSSI